MASLSVTFYNSAILQSVISMQLATIRAEQLGYTNTIVDLVGLTTGQVTTAISNSATASTLKAVFICSLTNATGASAKISYDQLASIDALLIAASRGTVLTTGTAESNSTVTNIILAAAATTGTTSAVDDAYKGKYIVTAGATAVYRYISGYTGATRIAVTVSTGSAITTTSTYTVYSPSSHVFIIGDIATSETACRVAWRTLWPTKQVPLIIQLLGGNGTIATGLNGVTDGVTTFKQAVVVTATATSATSVSLTHTGQFTASALIGKWIGIESSTLGAGQVRQITANTADVITVAAWTITPTGTIVYTISDNFETCLAHKYLPLVIPTYLYGTDSDTHAIWKKLIDKYGKLGSTSTRLDGDFELLKTYLHRGKCIFDAQVLAVVT
jgi:hypothetical protein